MIVYDAIIVGAGPAGNMAALKLSQSGQKVLVIDYRERIGDKLCTGIIGSECAREYPPNESLIWHEASGAAVVSPLGTKYAVSKSSPQAYVIDRVTYIQSFADKAMESGAEYLLGTRVTDVQIGSSEVKVTALRDSISETYTSKVIVVGSGFGSPVLRMAGLSNGKNSDYILGCQAIVTTQNLKQTEVYVGSQVAKGSFGWLVPIANDQALVGLALRERQNGHMDSFLDNLSSEGHIKSVDSEPNPWGIPIRPISKTYGDRVLAVGDTAGLVKPTTGGGIYYALKSGEMAASAIVKASQSNDFSARSLSGYEKEWKSIFGRELRIGYYARQLFEMLNDDQIERLLDAFLSGESMKSLIEADDFSFDWHSHIILKALRYKTLAALLMSFGPAIVTKLARIR